MFNRRRRYLDKCSICKSKHDIYEVLAGYCTIPMHIFEGHDIHTEKGHSIKICRKCYYMLKVEQQREERLARKGDIQWNSK